MDLTAAQELFVSNVYKGDRQTNAEFGLDPWEGAFQTPINLYYAVKKRYPNITLNMIKRWMNNRNLDYFFTKTRANEPPRHVSLRHYVCTAPWTNLFVDTVHFVNSENFAYCFLGCDGFSNRMYLAASKNADARSFAFALQRWITREPRLKENLRAMYSDGGGEFRGGHVVDLFHKELPNCERYVLSSKNKAFKVENLARSLRLYDSRVCYAEGEEETTPQTLGMAAKAYNNNPSEVNSMLSYQTYMINLGQWWFNSNASRTAKLSCCGAKLSHGATCASLRHNI
jgi:hypothetical protein